MKVSAHVFKETTSLSTDFYQYLFVFEA